MAFDMLWAPESILIPWLPDLTLTTTVIFPKEISLYSTLEVVLTNTIKHCAYDSHYNCSALVYISNILRTNNTFNIIINIPKTIFPENSSNQRTDFNLVI